MKILVVEDDKKIASALKKGLEAEGFDVGVARSAEEALAVGPAGRLDLVVLDLMLPGKNGLEVLTSIRRREDRIPVLILTAKDSVEDRVRGLDSGADDYVVKPFAFSELLARIRALLRRGTRSDFVKLRVADLEMDVRRRAVVRSGRSVVLTGREYEILEYLLRNQGQIVTREMLAKEVWHETRRATPIDNVIDVHIAHLRKKVDEPFAKKLLHTVRGVGFILEVRSP